jgi:hypothetical protein
VKRNVYNLLVVKRKGKNHMEDIGIDGRIILRCIFAEWGCGGIDWIDLVQDRDS